MNAMLDVELVEHVKTCDYTTVQCQACNEPCARSETKGPDGAHRLCGAFEYCHGCGAEHEASCMFHKLICEYSSLMEAVKDKCKTEIRRMEIKVEGLHDVARRANDAFLEMQKERDEARMKLEQMQHNVRGAYDAILLELVSSSSDTARASAPDWAWHQQSPAAAVSSSSAASPRTPTLVRRNAERLRLTANGPCVIRTRPTRTEPATLLEPRILFPSDETQAGTPPPTRLLSPLTTASRAPSPTPTEIVPAEESPTRLRDNAPREQYNYSPRRSSAYDNPQIRTPHPRGFVSTGKSPRNCEARPRNVVRITLSDIESEDDAESGDDDEPAPAQASRSSSPEF